MHDDRGLDELTSRLRDFARERDWEQFHTARNLLLALVGEVGELAAEAQWLSDSGFQQAVEHDAKKRQAVQDELADVQIYLVRLADVLGIDLLAAAHHKIDTNTTRYPIRLATGTAAKYNELPDRDH